MTVFEQEIINSDSKEIASCMVQSLQVGMVQQTYTSKITLLLGGIGFTEPRGEEVINIISTSSNIEDSYLFKVTFIQVGKFCFFVKQYDNIPLFYFTISIGLRILYFGCKEVGKGYINLALYIILE